MTVKKLKELLAGFDDSVDVWIGLSGHYAPVGTIEFNDNDDGGCIYIGAEEVVPK